MTPYPRSRPDTRAARLRGVVGKGKTLARG